MSWQRLKDTGEPSPYISILDPYVAVLAYLGFILVFIMLYYLQES